MKKLFKRLVILVFIIILLLSLFLNIRYRLMLDTANANLSQALKQTKQLQNDFNSLQKDVFKLEAERQNLAMQVEKLKDQKVTPVKKEILKEEPVKEIKSNRTWDKAVGVGIGLLTFLKGLVVTTPVLVP